MEVFFYIPKEKESSVLACGLKLNDWASRIINIDGIKKKYIPALLNPKDDLLKFNDINHVPLKIEVDPAEILVADGAVYRDEDIDDGNNLYVKSLVFLDKYSFGSIRLPECLIPSTVSDNLISKLDKRIDVPVLYDSSEELYIQHEMERCRESYDNFLDSVLYSYYERLVSLGLCIKHYITDNAIVVYESLLDGHIITIRRA